MVTVTVGTQRKKGQKSKRPQTRKDARCCPPHYSGPFDHCPYRSSTFLWSQARGTLNPKAKKPSFSYIFVVWAV